MEVFDVVKVANGEGKMANVHLSDMETRMLLTFAINELINRGSLSLLTEEQQEELKGLEELLNRDVEGTA